MSIITLTKQWLTNSPAPTGQQTEVTPEMLRAGARVLLQSGFLENSESDTGLSLLLRDVLTAIFPSGLAFSGPHRKRGPGIDRAAHETH